MRILLAHNFYGSKAPSGENQAFEAERDLLRGYGHDVKEFVRSSDAILARGAFGLLQGAASTPWNPFVARAIRKAVDSSQFRVVHVHNTFPNLSPSIFSAIGHRAARVLTLHNYRLFCPAGIPTRDGQVCTRCLDTRSSMPAIRYGCYRGSRLATIPLAAKVSVHRILGTWVKHVDAFIALTNFQREIMIAAGLPRELVHVKPNFYPGNPPIVPWSQRRQAVVFAGRLGVEKGLRAIIEAWIKWGRVAPQLRIIGDGQLRNELESSVAAAPGSQVVFLGQVTAEKAREEIAHAKLALLASECYEGFPMVVREAFAFGTPAAVSDIGPLPSIIQKGKNGVVFEPCNAQSLLQVVRMAWESNGVLEKLAHGARESFESLYNERVNYQILMDVYDQAVGISRWRKERHR